MVNTKHLEVLTRGINDWNEWRREHPEMTPNLSGAVLNRANLSGANLTEADLTQS